MSTINVTNLKHGSSSTNSIVFSSDGTCDVKASNISGQKNLIINGSMQVAQRGTSSTSSGYQTLDRWQVGFSGHNEAPTQSQHALTSSDTGPWEKGFRKSLHIQNGNQTSTDASDYCEIVQTIEAQNMANSGWNYNSTSNYVTLSFWVKSSVAQNFYGFFMSRDGTNRMYPFETGSLSADTWTKVTKSVPGATNIQFDDDNGQGLTVEILPFYGTTYTNDSTSLNTWANWDGNAATPDNTSTWWTTDNATFEITGVQLELGDTATTFEHRSYGDELAKCQRYYLKDTDTVQGGSYIKATTDLDNVGGINVRFPVTMRADPALTLLGTTYRTGGHTDAQSSFKNGFIWGRKTYGNNSDTSCMAYATGGFECNAEI